MQRCEVHRHGGEEVQRWCSKVVKMFSKMQRHDRGSRGVELQAQVLVLVLVHRTCVGGAEVRRCGGAEVQRYGDAEVQRCICRCRCRCMLSRSR